MVNCHLHADATTLTMNASDTANFVGVGAVFVRCWNNRCPKTVRCQHFRLDPVMSHHACVDDGDYCCDASTPTNKTGMCLVLEFLIRHYVKVPIRFRRRKKNYFFLLKKKSWNYVYRNIGTLNASLLFSLSFGRLYSIASSSKLFRSSSSQLCKFWKY